jgi:hypothetical protein
MASPEPMNVSADPVMVAGTTPRAISNALVESERVEFERELREEMRLATQTLDLTSVLAVLHNWRKIADLTQRQGVEAHERMLAVVADLQQGKPVATIGAAETRAVIAARLAQ